MNNKHYDLISFNMEEPIKIMDLAKVIVSSVNNGLKSPVELTKLSSEEKINESLLAKNEKLIPSVDKDIYYVENKGDIMLNLKALKDINTLIKNEDVKLILKNICYS